MVGLAVLSAVLAASGTVLLVWAIAYRRLSYALSESALRVEWLGRTLVVPYEAIQGIYTGQRLSGQVPISRARWPGIVVGTTRTRGLGRLRFFATSRDQSELTLVTVESGAVVVSAEDPNEFRAALIERVQRFEEVGEPRTWHLTEASETPWTAVSDLWLPLCAFVGIVLLLVTVVVVAQRYDSLPDQLPLHFDVSGQPSQISSKSDLLRLPLLGLACLLVNWIVGVLVHPRERVLARLLWLGAAAVQAVLLLGVLRLVA